MKKLLYILLFALVSASAITACTEEEVGPTANDAAPAGAGGGGMDPK